MWLWLYEGRGLQFDRASVLVDGAGCVVLLWIIFIIPRNMSVASTNVRRCLFGSLDSSSRGKSAELSTRHAKLDAQRFKEKWNYDVTTDTPLNDGSFVWITPPPSDIPSVYYRNYDCRRTQRRPQQRGDSNTDDNDDGGSSAGMVSQARPVQCGDVNVVLGVSNASQKQVEDETTPHKGSDSGYYKKSTIRLPGRTIIQTRLMDFKFQTKKRSATPEAESVVCSKKRRVDSS